MPIGVFLIRHPDGPILIDTGSSPQCMQAGYFPYLSYFVSVLNELEIAEDEGVVTQLAKKGVRPKDLQAVVLTHLHHDHAGGLEEIVKAAPDVPVFVDPVHWEAFGKHPTWAAIQGCAPNHWPQPFEPKMLQFGDVAVGPWPQSAPITKDGQIVAVQTPGHVPGHVSVVVNGSPLSYLLTGDATYSLELLEREEPDGINDDPVMGFKSLQLMKEFARGRDVVVIPNHDPQAAEILSQKRIYKPG